MLAFVIGTVCVIGLINAVRRRRRRRGRWGAPSLFERLGTTPAQEEAIRSALAGLREDGQLIRDELRETRSDLARVVRGGLVDDTAFEESFARHDRLLARIRVSVVEAAKRAVEVLDESQRKSLADRIEGRNFLGGRSPWRGGPTVWV